MIKRRVIFKIVMASGPLIITVLLAALAYFILSNIYFKTVEAAQGKEMFKVLLSVWKDIKNPISGTLIVTAGSIIIAAPLGIMTGVYLHEYSSPKISVFGINLFRYLSSVPSIVIGVFGLIMILSLNHIFGVGIRTGLLISVLSLSMLVLPYIVQSTFSALSMVPDSLRNTSLSLGAKKYQNIIYVLLPESIHGILAGVVLSIGRAAEDTAVIMLTGAAAFAGIPSAINDSFEALPFFIYYKSSEYQGKIELAEIFIAAALIIIISGLFILLSERISSGMKKKFRGEKRRI